MRLGQAAAFLLLTLFATAAAPRMEASRWVFLDLGSLGGARDWSYGLALNNAGVIAGHSYIQDPNFDVNPVAHGFIWSNGTMRDIGLPPASGTGGVSVAAINARGDLVGASIYPTLHAYQYRGGTWSDLGFDGKPTGINDAGVIVGAMTIGRARHAVVVKDAVIQDIDNSGGTDSQALAINNRGQVVGYFTGPDGFGRAFLWESGSMATLPLPSNSFAAAVAINDAGTILATTCEPFGSCSTYLVQSSMVHLILARADQTSYIGHAINNRGEVVGSMSLHNKPYGGFFYANGNLVDLDQLPAVRAAGFKELNPAAINDRGWITGAGKNADGEYRAFALMRR
jgi:probable HAF family extracellular repeat protein